MGDHGGLVDRLALRCRGRCGAEADKRAHQLCSLPPANIRSHLFVLGHAAFFFQLTSGDDKFGNASTLAPITGLYVMVPVRTTLPWSAL